MKQVNFYISLIVYLFLSLGANAQTPMYYKGGGTGGNNFPFNGSSSSGSMVQLLYVNTCFQAPPPSGTITTIYFRPSGSSTASYTTLSVKLLNTTLTTLTSGTWNSGMNSAFLGNTSLTAVSGNWMAIQLQTPFQYDNTKSLLVEVSQVAQTGGFAVYTGSYTGGNARMYGVQGSSTSTGADNSFYDFGFDLLPKKGMNNAAVSAIISPVSPFCSGTGSVQVQIKNTGVNRINNVRVYWEMDGIPQPYVTYSTLIDTIGSVAGNAANVTLGNFFFDNLIHSIKVYTSIPNGIQDTVNSDDTMIFYKRSSPLAQITTTGQTAYCGGGAVNTVLNAPTGPGYSYQWRLNTTNIPGATAASYTATSAGDFTVRVDSGSCYNISPILRIDNLAMPQPSVTPETYAVYCDGDSITLNANAGISGATYQWFLQGIAIPGATNASYIAKLPGNYIVKTTKFSCTVSSPGTNISQVPPPTPVITKNINVLSTGGNYVSYQWYLNGNILPDDTFAICIAKQAGTYTVKVSNGGCTAIATGVDVTASEAATGINNTSLSNAIRIYPNPATSFVHISSPIPVKTSICSVDGKILVDGNGLTEFNICKLASGVYIIRLTDSEGSLLKIEKLIKN